MKQKIVIKVHVRCKKCWSKAMEIVAVAEGEIFSVAWEGDGKDKMVVIGDGINAATLTTKLDKKLGCAKLLLVEDVKEKKVEPKEPEKKNKDPEPKEPEKKKKDPERKEPKKENKDPEPTLQCCQPYCPCKQQLCTQPSYPFEYRLCGPVVYVYEDPCTSACNIM